MKATTPKSAFSIGKIYCSIFGHDFQLSKEVTGHIKEYKCTHCQQEATTNVRGRLELMTPKLKEINALLTKVYAKKMARKANQPQFKAAS